MLGWKAAGVPCSPFRSATPHSTASRARRFPLQMIFNCSIFDGNHCSNLDGSGQFSNITIKKIPQMLLGRCEFNHDDYSLNIIDLPQVECNEEPEDESPIEKTPDFGEEQTLF